MPERVARLLDLIKRQRDVYQKMLDLARQQVDMVRTVETPADLDGYLSIANRRRDLLQEAGEYSRQAAEIQEALARECGREAFVLKSLKDVLSPAEYEELARGYVELGQTMKDLTEMDDTLAENLRYRLEKMKNPDKNKVWKQARDAYRKGGETG